MRRKLFGETDEQPRFEPWIGDAYRASLQADAIGSNDLESLCRFHLMGESHYSEGDEPQSNWTIRAVEDWALKLNRYGAFWTKAIQTVDSTTLYKLDRFTAWHRVAFSNFQQDVLRAPRDPVPETHLERGRRCFFAQLYKTRPTTLVVLGKRLFANLPNEGMRVRWPLTAQPDWEPVTDAWLYPFEIEDGKTWLTVAVSVPHPSSGRFSGETARQRVQTVQLNYSNVVSAWNNDDLIMA